MLTKIIEVYGDRNYPVEDILGKRYYHTPGTTRLVEQFNLLPKTLEGKRRGWFSRSLVVQKSEIGVFITPLSELYNEERWRDVRYINN